jgi:hypothetical protein
MPIPNPACGTMLLLETRCVSELLQHLQEQRMHRYRSGLIKDKTLGVSVS